MNNTENFDKKAGIVIHPGLANGKRNMNGHGWVFACYAGITHSASSLTTFNFRKMV